MYGQPITLYYGKIIDVIFFTAHSPQVIKHPSDKTDTSPESTVTFHITAIGKTPLKYQWYMKRRDGDVRMAIARASNSSHCIADLSKTDEGEYTCTVSNDDGKCTSNSAILTVGKLTYLKVNANIDMPYKFLKKYRQ